MLLVGIETCNSCIDKLHEYFSDEMFLHKANRKENGTLPGMKMSVLSAGRSSVVHQLVSLPSVVLAAYSSAKSHQLFYFFFFKTGFCIDWYLATALLCPLCGFGVGCLLKQESEVWSSISGSAPPIDSLVEQRIKFTLQNATLNFRAHPNSDQFSPLDLLLCQNSRGIDTFPLRRSP